MKYKALVSYIEEQLDYLPDERLSSYDASPLSIRFLKVLYKIAKAKKSYATYESKYKGLLDVEYKAAWRDVEGRNAAEREAYINAEGRVLVAKERYADMKAKAEYLKACQRIFEHAHVLCRQVSNDNDN